ncbi:MAG: exo-alpha-sialidase [Deferribacteres bacterium]|nr:exo-alpha-sialidase [candidate division KSB1 bacterium]MCB9503275.1 exo-alpha-sialidase [Deferribacteres bacterium]
MKKPYLFLLMLSLVFSGRLSAQTELLPATRLAKKTYGQSSQHFAARERYEALLAQRQVKIADGIITKKPRVAPALKHSRSLSHSIANSTDFSEFKEFPAHLNSAVVTDEIFPLGLDNGELLMFFRVLSWDTDADSIFVARSSDTGLTWQPSQLVSSSEIRKYDAFQGLQSASGRIIISYFQWTDFGPATFLVYSDDHGVTWSEHAQIAVPASAVFSMTNDGSLWAVYLDEKTGNIHYKTSADDGISWAEDRMLLAPDDYYDRPTIASGDGATLHLFYLSINRAPIYQGSIVPQLYQRTSTDGGATWSSPIALSQSDLATLHGTGPPEFHPRKQSDGTMWIIYSASGLKEVASLFGGTGYDWTGDWNVFYRTSADGGQTWSTPQQFTRYSGKDFAPHSTIINDQLIIQFNTSRWQSVETDNIYLCGIPGITQDNNPPPTGRPRREWLATAQNKQALLQFEAFDESGLAKVEGYYQINDGATIGPILLNDAGENGDQVASDGMWSGFIGELKFGDMASSSCQVTDVDGNTVTMNATNYTVFPYHTAGNVTLLMTNEGLLGGSDYGFRSDAQGHWPRINGHDYLWYGGLWVGSDIDGEKRVMMTGSQYDSDWQPAVGSQITEGTVVSDQDISMYYDDLHTPRMNEHQPIGLKVHQESFQWADSTNDDFLIFRYTLFNTGYNGDLTDVVVALFMNLAAHNDNPRYEFGKIDDMVGYDAERNLFYMFDAEGDPETHVGVKILSGHDLLAIETETNWDLESDNDYYDYISTGKGIPTEPREAEKIMLSTRLSGLANGDSATISFGLVFGENLEHMQANANAMDAAYQNFSTETAIGEEVTIAVPTQFELKQNYPNPFNPGTQISFDLPQNGEIEMSIFNTSGQLVRQLIKASYTAGSHTVSWDGRDAQGLTVASGLYFYVLRANNFVQTKKMLKLK